MDEPIIVPIVPTEIKTSFKPNGLAIGLICVANTIVSFIGGAIWMHALDKYEMLRLSRENQQEG